MGSLSPVGSGRACPYPAGMAEVDIPSLVGIGGHNPVLCMQLCLLFNLCLSLACMSPSRLSNLSWFSFTWSGKGRET